MTPPTGSGSVGSTGSNSSSNVHTIDPPASVSSSSAMASAMASLMVSVVSSSASSSAEQIIIDSLLARINDGSGGGIPNTSKDDDNIFIGDVYNTFNYRKNINSDAHEMDFAPTSSALAAVTAAATATEPIHLPQLISATVPKQRDQPAGLTLISKNGVIISAISPSSPFHVDNANKNFDNVGGDVGGGKVVDNGRTITDNNEQQINATSISKNNNNNIIQSISHLQVNDEILLINSHRVKNPQRAVQLIKGTRSGQLTIVASRQHSTSSSSSSSGSGEGGGMKRRRRGGGGLRQMQGMSYILARVDTNPFVIHSDLHDETEAVVAAASAVGEKNPLLSHSFSSLSPPPPPPVHPSTSKKYGDNIYGLQFSSISSPPTGNTTTSSNKLPSLTRISYKSNTTGPFAKTDLKLGDVVLSIDGNAVCSVGDAERLLNGTTDSSDLGGGGINGNSSGGSSNTRVVVLLVYSLWDLRKRVLENALRLDRSSSSGNENGGTGDDGGGGGESQQLWQASYSYEVPTKNEGEEQNEHILLRIQNTTVTFQLDFDIDGNCSCRDHYKSLLSLDSMEEQQRQSREIQNAMMKSEPNINGGDSDSIMSDGNNSTYSREDALAALELLYQIHVVPVISALNCHTWRQLRSLAEAVAAAAAPSHSTCTTLVRQMDEDGGNNEEGTLDRRVEGILPAMPTTSVAIVPFLTADDTIKSVDEKRPIERQRRHQRQSPSPPREIQPQQKEENLVLQSDNQVGIMTVAKPQNEQWMTFVRNQSFSDSIHHASGLTNGEGRPPRRHSVETYSGKIPDESSRPRNIRRQTVDDSSSGQRMISRPTVEEEVKVDNSPELNPNRIDYTSFPVIQITKTPNNTPHNQRRPPAKMRIQRKPSIVPEFNLNHTSFRTALSALSDSEDDSSGSDTTTTDSDASNSSTDSGSSEDDEHLGHLEYPQARREQHRQTSRSPNTSQLIVYSPEDNGEESNKVVPSASTATNFTTNVPQLKRRLKMRNGEIRKYYKVLHHVVGTGSFGTVRTCVHRSTRQRYVVKSISVNGNNMKNATLLQDEIALVQRVHHKNVVSVRDVIQDRQFIHIVMDKCHGGDLFDKIVNGGVRLSEERACEILSELLDAVAYLHERNIVHRDLKAEHVMLSSKDINSPIKIIDFGLATIHSPNDPPLTALAGSAFTIAPEVINRSYGKSCDLWSVGVIAYFLLTCCMPFNAKSDEEIFAKILGGKYTYPQWARWGLSEKAKDFVGRLLVVDPKRRINAKQALGDTWFRKNSMGSSPRTRTNLNEFVLVQPPPMQTASLPPMRSRQQMMISPKPAMSPLQSSTRPLVSPVLIQNATALMRSGQYMSSNPGELRSRQQIMMSSSRRRPETERHRQRVYASPRK